MFRARPAIVAIATLLVLTLGSEAWAWGPGTHIKLASSILSNLWLLPAGIGALIAKHRRYFIYGNVATDTVFAKKMSKVKQICHRWDTGFGLLKSARTDAGRAFAQGYLAHLAADTVAHNKFLPRQMAVTRSTVSFGHLYWEIRADAQIERVYWRRLGTALRGEYVEPERLLERHLQETILSFRANRAIFKRMNLLACERGWRRSVEFWSKLSRFDLDPLVLNGFHEECLDRVIDVLSLGESSAVLHDDPSGNAALSHARAQRRQLRQMKRARMPHDHIIREAVAGHAPGNFPRMGCLAETGPRTARLTRTLRSTLTE
jgi:hypothetical protein